MNIFILLRIICGSVLIVSGFEKLISPYQNFLYVIENYDFLTTDLAYFVARVLPWIEFFAGVFTVLGLWTKQAVTASGVLFLGFMIVVGQSLIRHLPINECGCFGSLVTFPPRGVLVMDSCLFITCLILLRNVSQARKCALDNYFEK